MQIDGCSTCPLLHDITTGIGGMLFECFHPETRTGAAPEIRFSGLANVPDVAPPQCPLLTEPFELRLDFSLKQGVAP